MYGVLRTTYQKLPTFTSIFPVLPHHNMEAIFSIPFTVLEVPNLKLKRPGWVKQPSAMVMFSMVLFSYFLVTGGKVFEHVSIVYAAGRHALGLPGITIFQRACIILRGYVLSTGISVECIWEINFHHSICTTAIKSIFKTRGVMPNLIVHLFTCAISYIKTKPLYYQPQLHLRHIPYIIHLKHYTIIIMLIDICELSFSSEFI